MAERGGQPGNKNAAKSRIFEQAIVRALKQRDLEAGDGETIRKIADKLIDLALDGQVKAFAEMRDTVDGRPTQTIAGDPDNPLGFEVIERRIVDPKA
jgi:hypothetical protein